MGLLYGEKLEPQPYHITKNYQNIIKQNAVLQITKLLSEFGNFQKTEQESLKFGTEVEFFIFEEQKFQNKKIYTVTVNNKQFLSLMNTIKIKDFEIHPEFPKFMQEIIPEKPFAQFIESQNIQNHLSQVHTTLMKQKKFKILFGGSTLPFLGSQKQMLDSNNRIIGKNQYQLENKFSNSETFLDQFITDHSRFKSFTLNTRLRRKEKPQVNVPIFEDKNTNVQKICFDHMGFGMSNSALQITYSTKNLKEARWLYDQFHVMSPFFLAASATSSVIANMLLDIDARFPLIAQSTDDRNPRERESIDKPKYSTINYYISNDSRNKKNYNDKKYTINKKMKKSLKNQLKKIDNEFVRDENLLNHFAYLLVRDVLVVFPDQVKKNHCENTMDFESINSCNWNDVRLKPPQNFNKKIGWLVEFRPMDIPITNKEKTAMIFMCTVFQRMIVDEQLGVNFYVPISVVDENFNKSYQRGAFTNAKIKVRKYFSEALHGEKVNLDDIVEVTFKEFLEGNFEYDGMKQLIQKFIEFNEEKFSQQNQQEICYISQIWQVFDFFVAKASGKLLTGASYIRNFVQKNQLYKQNSKLSDELCTQLIDNLMEIQQKDQSEEMLGNFLNFLVQQLKFINFQFSNDLNRKF